MVFNIETDSTLSQPIRIPEPRGPMRTRVINLKTSLYKYIPEFFELLELMALFSIRHLRSLNPPKLLSGST